jgi:hypothetical protein
MMVISESITGWAATQGNSIIQHLRPASERVLIIAAGGRTGCRHSPRPSPDSFNQDPTHGLGSGRKKVGAVGPFLASASGQANPGFMNQRGGLERMAGLFLDHASGGEAPQFIINQRQQFLGCQAFAGGSLA